MCNQLKKFEGSLAHHGAVCGWCQARLVAVARRSKHGRAWEDFSDAEREEAKGDSLRSRAAWAKRVAEEKDKKEAAEQAKKAKAKAAEKAKADKEADAAQKAQEKDGAAETEAAQDEQEQKGPAESEPAAKRQKV